MKSKLSLVYLGTLNAEFKHHLINIVFP